MTLISRRTRRYSTEAILLSDVAHVEDIDPEDVPSIVARVSLRYHSNGALSSEVTYQVADQILPGEDGEDGEDGASAYELAVQLGFEGTLEEWLTSLEGAQGEPGEGGGTPGEELDPIVCQFGGRLGDPTITQSDHGVFWPTGEDLGHFSWEFWSCALDDSITGYLVSEGYGGAHSVLFTAGGPNVGVRGNTWNGTVENPFTGNYTPQLGEWVYSRCGWDGTYLYTWINGIMVGIKRWTNTRRAQQGTVYIAGSDHSNFTGKIAMVRAYEGSCPIFSSGNQGAVYVPSRSFMPHNPTDVSPASEAQLCSHYLGTPGARMVPDISDGYEGQRHHGQLKGLSLQPLVSPEWVTDPTAPFQSVEPARTRVPGAPLSVPAGAKVFDSCGRADSIPAFSATFPWTTSPGSTEGGSLGVKEWQLMNASSKWGVFDGALVNFALSAPSGIWVNNNSSDMDIRLTRKDADNWGDQMTSGGGSVRSEVNLVFRYVDESNFLTGRAYYDTAGSKIMTFAKRVAGVNTNIANFTLPNFSWSTQRWVLAGTTITFFVDSVQIGQSTGVTDHQSATGVGLYCEAGSTTAVKATNFTVY